MVSTDNGSLARYVLKLMGALFVLYPAMLLSAAAAEVAIYEEGDWSLSDALYSAVFFVPTLMLAAIVIVIGRRTDDRVGHAVVASVILAPGALVTLLFTIQPGVLAIQTVVQICLGIAMPKPPRTEHLTDDFIEQLRTVRAK